jgi:hypothetical protein
MNRHEQRYRWTGKALLVLLGLWVAAMLLVLALPAALQKTGVTPVFFFMGIFPILFAAIVVPGVMRMVAYIRWTGKYPYYFVLSESHRGTSNPAGKGAEGGRPEKNHS